MSSTSSAERLRVAIALSALRFKPAGQSFESYVLDLRATFCSSKGTVCIDDDWRDRALSLEKDLAELKQKYDEDHIKLLSLRASASTPPATLADPPNGTSGKKKVKKKPNLQQQLLLDSGTIRGNLDIALNGLHSGPDLLSIPGPRSLFSAFEALHNVRVSSDQGHPTPLSFLVPTANRVLEALGAFLLTALPPNGSSSMPGKVSTTILLLLPELLATVLPALLAKVKYQRKAKLGNYTASTAVNDFLGSLADTILVPILRSFASLSRSYVSDVFSVNKKVKDCGFALVDIRPDLLSLLRQTMSILSDLGFHAAGMQHNLWSVEERLALEAARQMESLYDRPSVDASVDGGTMHQTGVSLGFARTRACTPQARVDRLAEKDALWYLCNSCHLFLTSSSSVLATPSTPGDTNTRGSTLLQEGILTSLSRLVRRTTNSLPSTILDSQYSQRRDHEKNVTGSAKASSEDEAGNRSESLENGSAQSLEGDIADEVGHDMLLVVVERAWLYFSGRDADTGAYRSDVEQS